jgi:hypothetical protein
MRARRRLAVAFVAAPLVVCAAMFACDDPAPPAPRADGGDAGFLGPIDAGADATPPGPDASGCASKHAAADGSCQPLVFVTTTAVQGDLGGDPKHVGVERGDAVCQAEADKVVPGKVFKAWLSGGGVAAAARLEHLTTSYRLIDGTTVANSWERMASPAHMTAIDLQIDGTRIGPTPVFTGTNPDGTENALTCDDWSTTDSAKRGLSGSSDNVIDGHWTSAITADSCDSASRLYCVEQLGQK